MMPSSILNFMLFRANNILFLISILGVVICILPLFLLDSYHKKGFEWDNTLFIHSELKKSLSMQGISIFIAIIPLVDILLDFCQKIWDWFNKRKSTKRHVDTVIYRLTDKERFFFCIGMILQSTVFFLPSDLDVSTMVVIYHCTRAAAQIFFTAPILFYLERCTTTFSRPAISVILISFTISLSLSAWKNFSLFDPSKYHRMKACEMVFFGFGLVLFLVTVIQCFISYCIEKYVVHSNRRFCINSFTRSIYNFFKSDGIQIKSGVDLMYTHYIPALHMISFLIISIVGLLKVKEQYHVKSSTIYDISLFGQIMVLVIELRIRKYEIAKGLTALLDSKKLYVRYISHEIRTPLNTAYLGLKLLSEEFKTSTDVKDIERYDTLFDVNRSCEAAIDILNDLLCYEKIESGILELHKEEITVLPYLSDCLSMFTVQARECGVTMHIDTEVSDTHYQANMDNKCEVTSPLQPHDIVSMDKFKMNQVIRNLMSNALKFTPIGGNVVMQAYFVHDVKEALEGRDRNVVAKEVAPHSKSTIKYAVDYVFRHSLQIYPVMEGSGKNNLDQTSKLNQSEEDQVSSIAGNLVLVVTDTGAGMSENNQSRLFKEIVQFNPEKLQAGGGSGLGLWITSSIMDMHDGQIRVASGGEGKGSSFTVKIPMLRHPPLLNLSLISPPPNVSPIYHQSLSVPVVAISRPPSYSRISVAPISSPPTPRCPIRKSYPLPVLSPNMVLQAPKSVNNFERTGNESSPCFEVLVVDDSNMNRKMLIKCLELEHHICEYAADGLQAIEKVAKRMGWNDHSKSDGCVRRPYDVILMDFVMPLKDGPTATAELRAMEYTGAIFGVTGNGLTSDVEYFLNCGADKVLVKPLDMKAFSSAMKEKLR